MSDQEGIHKLLGLYDGIVVDNVDPEGLHRVRVRIPGLIDKSAWALPLGVGGGSRQRGIFQAPKKDSTVSVLFNHGDPDHPRYLGAHWGKPSAGSEMPTPVKNAPPDRAHEIQGMESDRWIIELDDRAEQPLCRVRSKDTGCEVTIDGKLGVTTIKGDTAVTIEAIGMIRLRAPVVEINGRIVAPSAKPI